MTRTFAAVLVLTVAAAFAGFVALNVYLFTQLDRSTIPAQNITFAGKVLTYKCELVKKAGK